MPLGIIRKLFRVDREDVERLSRKLKKIRFVFVVRRHQSLLEKIVESASCSCDRLLNVIGADENGVFLAFGLKIHIG